MTIEVIIFFSYLIHIVARIMKIYEDKIEFSVFCLRIKGLFAFEICEKISVALYGVWQDA
ncbi:MAG: hypothetical protein JETT_3809 [Candidatus Jettenia ecosi]|uniref:Uncharacterized protein n=1 Tax=Candidatus Jettenia ecosi TaxID=2494326 RepID=A0A533Q5V9_9BACT|nr:MAG: hypothetical protein JETT_3809 [Candidatus Jettenia ecosi]